MASFKSTIDIVIEWQSAFVAVNLSEHRYHTLIDHPNPSEDRLEIAHADMQVDKAKLEAIKAEIKDLGVRSKSVLHYLQSQIQEASNDVQCAKHIFEAVFGSAELIPNVARSAYARLVMSKVKFGALKVLENMLISLTDSGLGTFDALLCGNEETFKSLWYSLSPHVSRDAQEWKRKIFQTRDGRHLCDMSIIDRQSKSQHIVRDEYRKLAAFLYDYLDPNNKDKYTNKRMSFVIVTGQPGIGKSVFMRWILLKRIAAGKPTTWQTRDTLYLFGYHDQPDGPRQFLSVPVEFGERYNAFLSMPETWNLVDAEPVTDASYNSPCAALVARPSGLPAIEVLWPIIIYCTSHQLRRFKWWTNDRGGTCYYMEPWTLQEVLDSKAIGLFDHLSKADLVSRYTEVGGCIQGLLTDEQGWLDYRNELDLALAALFDTNAMHKAIINQYKRDDLSASNVFYVLPSHDTRKWFQVRPGSRYIQEILMKRIAVFSAEQKWAFWRMSLRVPTSQSVAASIYESFIHTNLHNLTLISHGPNSDSIPITLPTKEAQTSYLDENTSCLAQTTTWYIRPDAPTFPTIDSVLLTNDKRVFLFQITLGSRYPVKEDGLRRLEKLFPDWTQEVPWFFCFIGVEQEMLQENCSEPDIGNLGQKWREKLKFQWIL